MTDWTAGYIADIGYTFGYYPELDPLRARLALLDAGLVAPTFRTACELGFGQGLSANIPSHVHPRRTARHAERNHIGEPSRSFPHPSLALRSGGSPNVSR
jgi:hypothetical protein